MEVMNAAFAAGALGYAILIERRLTRLETEVAMMLRGQSRAQQTELT